jgi:hypothetical protein
MSTAHAEKACLFAVDNRADKLDFLFNPTSYSVSKAATWKRSTAKGNKKASPPEFTGTDPASLQMELLFDRWETLGGDVSGDVGKLFGWLQPTPPSHAANKPQPPILGFEWGRKHPLSWFTGFLKSVNAKYTMFRQDGTPTRATASITLEEVPADPQGQLQNPTSGGVGGHRTHIMTAGDSLQSLAYAEFGDATLWRRIALLNDIDDPLRVPTGTTLIIGRADDDLEPASNGAA